MNEQLAALALVISDQQLTILRLRARVLELEASQPTAEKT